MSIHINQAKLARDVQAMLESANAHLLADGVKHLNAYLYAAMARGALESAMAPLEYTDRTNTAEYQQLKELDVRAVALCEKFETLFDVKSRGLTVPVLKVEASGQIVHTEAPHARPYSNGRPDQTSKKRGPYRPRHSGLPDGKHTITADRSRRLSMSQRLEIWRWGQEHPKPSRREILEICEMYDTTEGTVLRWVADNPTGDHDRR